MASKTEVDAMIAKQTRRGIIDLLNLAYPAALDFEAICSNFLDLDAHYIQRDMVYFIQRNMVEWVNERPNLPWAARRFRLTARGVDEALRINTDPAITP